MTFKDAKQGTEVYIFNKAQTSVSKGIINSVSLPHINTQDTTKLGLYVDVSITVDNNTGTYLIPEGSSICSINGVSITPNIENLVEELKGAKFQSEQYLKSIDYHKSVVEKTTKLLAEYDPVYKRDQEVNNRMDRIENAISQLAENNKHITEILADLKK